MKKGSIIIDIGKNISSVSLIEEGKLSEHFVELEKNELLTGNIYKGKVVNVLGGLQSAFVDIGRDKNGFVFAGEITVDKRDIGDSEKKLPSVLNLKNGDSVLAQVTKEETEVKGARLATNISLPGRYSVYLPEFDFTGVSNKITDPIIREKLTEYIQKIKKDGEGFVARTAASACTEKEFIDEAETLRKTYLTIKQKYADTKEDTALIHSGGNLLFRTVRDMLRPSVESVVCNDPDTVEILKKEFCGQAIECKEDSGVRLYDKEKDILDEYSIIDGVDKLLLKKVDLASGGSLIIERTEALTAIDVNTARFSGGGDYSQTVFLTNCEAANEIARQIRLRNIGGIIVVDFIDMADEGNKNTVVDILRKAVAKDRIKTRVLDMTGLGLVELTRKKVGNDLAAFLLEPCSNCHGGFLAQSKVWIARKIKASLKRLFYESQFSSALVSLSPDIMSYILESKFLSLEVQEVWPDKRVYLIPNPHLKSQSFIITGSNAASLNLPNDAKLLV